MNFKSTFRFLSGCSLLIMLTACKPVLDVRLASPGERLPRPRFVVEDPSRPGERPLYDTIKVAESSGELYWHLRAEPFGDRNSVSQFAYAEDLPGFATVTPAKPLEAGRDYAVVVIGKGYGELRFRVEADGSVRAIH